jgi:hypothetical protein
MCCYHLQFFKVIQNGKNGRSQTKSGSDSLRNLVQVPDFELKGFQKSTQRKYSL